MLIFTGIDLFVSQGYNLSVRGTGVNYYLAIDIGASSGRHIVGREEDGAIKTEEVYRFSNGCENKGGRLVWNVKRLFSEVINGLKAAKEKGYKPDYIGIDTWAVDYALLDKDDNLLGDVSAYRDCGTLKAAEAVHRIISFGELYKRTGIQFQNFNTIYRLYADKSSGKSACAESMLMLPDYLGFLLTGVKKQEYTNATSTGLVNAFSKVWDEYIIKKLGLPAKLFGGLSQPSTVVGRLKKEITDEIGYCATLILPATHDTASAVEGIPMTENSPYISSGTWSLLGLKVGKAITDENSRKANFSNEGGAGYFRYQKNISGMWIVNRLRSELCPDKPFQEIVKEAEDSGFNGCVDVNDSSFLAPESMKAAFDKSLCVKPQCAGDYFRCAYTSLAQSYKTALDELKANAGADFNKLYIVGGGAKNGFLNKLTEEICNVKVIALPIEASALGNIKMQIKGSKKYV